MFCCVCSGARDGGAASGSGGGAQEEGGAGETTAGGNEPATEAHREGGEVTREAESSGEDVPDTVTVSTHSTCFFIYIYIAQTVMS